jgi:hypothetical protein
VAGSHGRAVVLTLCRVRVRAAHRDYWLAESRPEEWLLIEWPEGEEAPTKYWFSTLPANIAFHQLVDTAKLRSATTLTAPSPSTIRIVPVWSPMQGDVPLFVE